MTPPTAPHIRDMVQTDMELGYDDDAIFAAGYSTCLRTIQRMRHSFDCYGLVYIPPEQEGGRPRALDDFFMAELLQFLECRPSAYLDEMIYFLYDEYDLVVSAPTVWRALKRIGWSRKQQRKLAAQRNQRLRTHWLLNILPQYRPDQLIFLDESAACERTGTLVVLFSACTLIC